MAIISIDKLEASRRQLVQAIRCFFNSEDTVAMHTLACASRQILHDICLAREEKRDLEDSAEFLALNDESKKEFLRTLREPQNFLKHADNDPQGVISFNTELTELFIHDACQMYRTIEGKLFKEGMVFQLWMLKKYPDKFGGIEVVKTIVPEIDMAPNPYDLKSYNVMLRSAR